MKHTLRVSSQAGKIFFCAWQIYLASMCQPRLDPATAVISCGDPRYNWWQSCRSAEALSHDLNCHFLHMTVASFWRIPQAAFSLSLSHSYKSGRDGVTHEIGEHRHGLVPARHARGRKSMDGHHAAKPYDLQRGHETTINLYDGVWCVRVWPTPETLAALSTPLDEAILITSSRASSPPHSWLGWCMSCQWRVVAGVKPLRSIARWLEKSSHASVPRKLCMMPSRGTDRSSMPSPI